MKKGSEIPKNQKLLLVRGQDDGTQILGHLFLFQNDELTFQCRTLELSDKNNQQNISCIPRGTYYVQKHESIRYKHSFWVRDVPGRSEILIHVGNFFSNIRGCILVGKDVYDLNRDEKGDVISSATTIKKLHEAVIGDEKILMQII